MPYLPGQDEQEDQDKKLSQQSTVIQPYGSGSAPNQQGEGTRSGSFTNLNQYLQANKPQAAQMGGKIAEATEQKVEAARQGLRQAQSGFEQKVQEGSVSADEGFTQRAVSQPGQQGASDVERFRQMYGAKYTAPKQLSETQSGMQAISGYGKVQPKIERLGSEGGRFEALKETFGRPTYARGEQTMDQLLLGASEAGKSRLAQTQQKYSGLQTELEQARQESMQLAQQRAEETDLARQQAQQAIGMVDGQMQEAGAIPEYLKTLEQRAIQESKERQSLQQSIMKDPAGAMKALGITTPTYAVDPRAYVNLGAQNLTKEQVSTQEDVARMSALRNLIGMEDKFLQGDIGQKGEAYSFARDPFQAAVGRGKQEYQGQLMGLLSQMPQKVTDANKPNQASYNMTKDADRIRYEQDLKNWQLDQTKRTNEYNAQVANVNSALADLQRRYGLA